MISHNKQVILMGLVFLLVCCGESLLTWVGL